MKQFTKFILTMILTSIILLSTTIMTFAYDGHDPIGGNCISHPINYSVYNR
jgi:hypothetical protein